jgi:hypothetical protein
MLHLVISIETNVSSKTMSVFVGSGNDHSIPQNRYMEYRSTRRFRGLSAAAAHQLAARSPPCFALPAVILSTVCPRLIKLLFSSLDLQRPET